MAELNQQGKLLHTDVLVIGSGLAGLKVILEIHQLKPSAHITLVTKSCLRDSNSYWAQGGIAAVGDAQDSIAQHVADTIKAGAGLCDVNAVNTVVAQGPSCIQSLQHYGVEFSGQGVPDLAQEGGHQQRRIYHCGDRSGVHIIDALLAEVAQISQLNCLEYHTAVNLIASSARHKPQSGQAIHGAYVLDEVANKIHTISAKATILACGGAGKIYRYTTNSSVVTGDGIAMAYRAGARIGNLEFYQFHPTLLYHPQHNSLLLSETLRGEGAKLCLPKSGKRFMQTYAPDKLELATRDVVARAIFNEIERGPYNHVELDIRHHSREYLSQRFPGTYQKLKALGIDMAIDCIPVVPAAHYSCGGVVTDVAGQTDLDRLYAIGETAFSGLHGANRLASNSLLECCVMAKLCADQCVTDLERTFEDETLPLWSSHSVIDRRRASQLNAHWRGLRGEMTSYAGIIRTAAGLKDLQRLIQTRRDMIEEYYWQHAVSRDLIELRNIVLVAELIVANALQRRESRGGHFREDYPTMHTEARESIVRGQHFSVT